MGLITIMCASNRYQTIDRRSRTEQEIYEHILEKLREKLIKCFEKLNCTFEVGHLRESIDPKKISQPDFGARFAKFIDDSKSESSSEDELNSNQASIELASIQPTSQTPTAPELSLLTENKVIRVPLPKISEKMKLLPKQNDKMEKTTFLKFAAAQVNKNYSGKTVEKKVWLHLLATFL